MNPAAKPERPGGAPLREKRIALVVDHPQRDLPGLLLLGFELCQRGAVCHLVPLNLAEREVMGLAPDFVLLNYFRADNHRLAEWMVRAGISFGLLDTEGGAWETLDSYMNVLWRDRDLLRKARGVCTWGGVLAGHLVKEGVFDESQVTVTGCARFDFYDSKWRAVLDGPEDDGPPGGPGHFLINTNYSIGNPRFTSRAENIDYCHRTYGTPYETLTRRVEVEDAAIRETIAMTARLAADYPRQRIVLRPHPFEDPEPYRQRVGHLANVVLSDRRPIHPLICRSAAVMQRSCTTAIESVAAGVAALSPQWIPAPAVVPVAEAVSVPVESYAALRERLDEILAGTYRPTAGLQSAAARTISDWFYRFDGWSHRRVADVITASAEAWPSPDAALCRRLAYNSGVHRRFQKASSAARYLLGLSPDFSFGQLRNVPTNSWTNTAKHLDVEEARTLVARIEEAARNAGDDFRSIGVGLARERRDYRVDHHGHALTLSPEKRDGK